MKLKTEFRLAWINRENPKARPVRRPVIKRDLAHAIADRDKFLQEQADGKLAPYWENFEVEIQARKVSGWHRQEA